MERYGEEVEPHIRESKHRMAGWTPEQAIAYVQRVADTTLGFFEQPVAALQRRLPSEPEPRVTFQSLILTLQKFWAERGVYERIPWRISITQRSYHLRSSGDQKEGGRVRTAFGGIG